MNFYRRNKNKFNAQPTKCSRGHNHRSQLECSVCETQKCMEMGGIRRLIQTEKKLYLGPARIGYILDFLCEELSDQARVGMEAKGLEGPRWKIIKKLWRVHGEFPLEIWKGNARRPVLVETIVPNRKEENV